MHHSRADAIAHEFNMTVTYDVVRARSLKKAIRDLIALEQYDLVIIGVPDVRMSRKMRPKAPSRVWFLY